MGCEMHCICGDQFFGLVLACLVNTEAGAA